MKKKTYTYEEDYFGEYYVNAVTDFTPDGLQRLRNWFRGIFFALKKHIDVTKGKNKTAIEFGSALGAISSLLHEWGYTVTATDISNYSITRAKKLSPHITFFKQDIQKTLKKTEKYDLVICFDVIEHLKYPDLAIKNMYTSVKKNGVVLCSTPNDYTYAKEEPSHINVRKPGEWKKLFLEAGFKNVKILQISFIPFLYRFHWKLTFALPFGINYKRICSPVFIIAKKSN